MHFKIFTMGWPHNGAGPGNQQGWSEAVGAEHTWAWLVHKFGDFQANIGDLKILTEFIIVRVPSLTVWWYTMSSVDVKMGPKSRERNSNFWALRESGEREELRCYRRGGSLVKDWRHFLIQWWLEEETWREGQTPLQPARNNALTQILHLEDRWEQGQTCCQHSPLSPIIISRGLPLQCPPTTTDKGHKGNRRKTMKGKIKFKAFFGKSFPIQVQQQWAKFTNGSRCCLRGNKSFVRGWHVWHK